MFKNKATALSLLFFGQAQSFAGPVTLGLTTHPQQIAAEEEMSCRSVPQRLSTLNMRQLVRVDENDAWIPELATRWTTERTFVKVEWNTQYASTHSLDDAVSSLQMWQKQSQSQRLLKVEKTSATQLTLEYQNALVASFPVELCLVGISPSHKPKGVSAAVAMEHVPSLDKALEKLRENEIQFWLKDTIPRFLTRGLLVHGRGASVHKTASPHTTILRFGKQSILSDVAVRKALAAAINRRDVIKFSLDGNVALTDDLFFPKHPLYIANSKLNFNPAPAKALAFPKGTTLIVATEASDKWIAAAKGIAVQLKRVGLDANVKVLATKAELLSHLETCERCVALVQIPHMAINTLQLLGLNAATQSSKTVLQTIETLQNDMMILPLWNDPDLWLSNSKVKKIPL